MPGHKVDVTPLTEVIDRALESGGLNVHSFFAVAGEHGAFGVQRHTYVYFGQGDQVDAQGDGIRGF